MKNEKKKFLKRLIVMLAVVSMIFTNIPGSWSSILAATDVGATVLMQTSYRELLVGESYDFNIAGKQLGMKYQWRSSNKSVASVNKKGMVKARSIGFATITCDITIVDKTYTLKAKIYVREESKNPANGISIINKIDAMAPGEICDLNITYSPADSSDFINWTSSNTQIATVNRNGVVSAKSTGSVTITATTLNESISDSVEINISNKIVPSTSPTPTPTTTTPSTPTVPTLAPTAAPTVNPTVAPTVNPTVAPTVNPTVAPTVNPTVAPTVNPTIIPTINPSPVPTKSPVDENGFDSQERMVANFGTPVIDGDIDELWKNAYVVHPKFIAANVETTATFKTLWDDNALYILAEVKDSELSVQSGTPYMQDSLEIFLDENNDKTQEYGVDDLHLRVNYENAQSLDNGDEERFYTKTKIIDGGYLIEARVALKSIPNNGKMLGIDLQINESKGTNRIGTINVFDSTGSAWNDTSKFGTILLTGKTDGSTSGSNPYNLMNLIKSANKLDPARYKNFNIVTEAISVAEGLLATANVTQDQINAQYDALSVTITQLVLTDDAANEKAFTPAPDAYKVENEHPGTIVSLTYSAINSEGSMDEKKLNVYLPYGYDAPNNNQKYNVLYLMHGGGENENTIFGGPGESKELKKIIDNMIAKGDIEPLIVVTPTTNGGSGDVALFHQELLNTIIPFVETTYRTYAGNATREEIKASRDHRAFGGFSMGSVCTWYNYINCLDYIKYFIPLSGDCWVLGQGSGNSKPQETAEYLAKVAKDAGYTPKDYYLFCATGNKDIAYPNMNPQMEAMRKLNDSFIYSSDPSKGNFYFIVSDGGTHAWNWVNQYIYDILPDLFIDSNRIPVDENGLDSQGRMVAYFGTPVIDGNIDEVWENAVSVSPAVSTGATDTTATFKTLWDDNAIYVLAKVKDSNLSSEAGSVYLRDSIEIFIDEFNNKTKTYEVDDLQFRVNYNNQQSADRGEIDRFYTNVKIVEDGYIIEARVALLDPATNNKVLGFELSVNDAKGGQRIATFNVFDKTATAYDDTAKFGEVLLAGKADGAVTGLNPYDLINLIKNAQSIKLERYTNGNVVAGLITDAQAAIADTNTTQTQIDDLYAALSTAIRELKRSDQGFDDKECRQIPIEYKTTDVHMGTIERLDYTTSTYDADNKALEKYLNVYLPAGYDANDKSKKYNILYLIHGMGENQNTVFGGPGKNTEMMKILDNMIANGELEPMIVVTPTWYNEGNTNMFGLVQNFHNELINDILPVVEAKYNTYAASTSEADLIAARDHRAFGGFSMGSGCTWYNYINCLDYFKYYMPISLWCLADVKDLGFEGTDSEQMAQYLASIAKNKGYGPKDYYIYCATGTDDMAYSGMVNQIEAMKKLTDSFIFTADLTKGNFYFLTLEGGTHTWNCVNRYLYNMLPDLFLEAKLTPSPVDENGFDTQGRMVANFGTPVIDGDIDEVWNNAYVVNPKYVANNVETTATFKTLWDDNALYILAEVKDSELSVLSGTPYMQDSLEIFLDENNDKTKEYGVDDLHLRVNYENAQSLDNGDAERFYTKTKIVDGGYLIEARVALKAIPANGKVLGIDLQINESKGTNRIGTINVFDSSGGAWNDTTKFGEILFTGKADGATSGLNPYNLMNLIKSVNKLDPTRYLNFSIVADAITVAEGLLATENVTQEQINAQYDTLRTVITQLVLTTDAANEKGFTPTPDSYKMENTQAGTIVSLTYSAANSAGGTDVKNLNVYLPYGYDAANADTKYNVFYLMHGGGENENTIFGGAGQSKELKKILDNMIANGDIEPMIVVTPTFYGGSNDVALFHQELLNVVIPLVETTYHTYAGTATQDELKASRDHRAFGGFSMGSICTWYNYINLLDYIKFFVPLSGECRGLGSNPQETSENLAKVAKDAGYTTQDYYLFCATGNKDIAYPNMNPQMEEMRKLTDSFVYSSDPSTGNFYFIVSDGGTHAWNWVNQYIYDILPDLFKNTVDTDPVVEPSTDPAVEPGTDPVVEPSTDPVVEPSTDPVVEPSTDPVVEPSTDPVVEPSTDPVVEPSTDPVVEPSTDPVVEPSTDPVVEPSTDPVVEPSTDPVVEPSTDPVVEPSTDPVVEPSTDPVVEPSTDPVVEPSTDPVVEPSTDPVVEPSTDPVVEPSTDPVVEPSTDPVVEPSTEPVVEPSTEPAVEL